MKLTKKHEAEILKIYNSYWEYYLNGNVKGMAALLDEGYTQVGSAETEVFSDKKGAVKFLHDTIDQVAGKLEMRNRDTKSEQHGELIFFHELCDVYVSSDTQWVFYSKFRATTIMRKKKGAWKIIHQHSSFPDARTGEGENIAAEKISAENRQLREAIKRRTTELESKNRELEIETALEKVRSVATGMKEPADMLKICKTISQQLAKLGVREIRNVQTAIFYESKGVYMNYEFYAKHDKTFITETDYTNHSIAKAFATKMMKGKGQFYKTHIRGRKVKDWIAYQKTTNVFIDKYLNKASSLNYYWHSLGPVALGISTYEPLTKENSELFLRFLKVFELAYKRYLDIEKAAAQAREAKIEAALEKVRAQAMAMHKSEELLNVCEVMYKELKALGFHEIRNAMIHTFNDKNDFFLDYDYSGGSGKKISKIPVKGIVSVENYLREITKSNDAILEMVLKGKDLQHWKDVRKATGQLDDKRIDTANALYYYYYSTGTGDVGISTFSPVSKEKIQVMERFRNVFRLSYQRYLDIEKAEAQARESQIELAVERVRAKALAMHKSEEILGVAMILRQELVSLNIPGVVATTIYLRQDNGDVRLWDITSATDTGDGIHFSMNFNFRVEEASPGLWIRKIWDAKENYVVIEQNKKDLYRAIEWTRRYNPETADMTLQFLKANNIVQSWHPAVKLSNGKLATDFIQPPPAEMEFILSKMGAAFDLAYKRFLDLQKAEAQAREAQIEAALERVRAQAMSMMKSDELLKICESVFKELRMLGFNETDLRNTQIIINNDDKRIYSAYQYSDYTGGEIAEVSYDLHPVIRLLNDKLRQAKDAFADIKISGAALKDWKKFVNSFPQKHDVKLNAAKELHYYFYSVGIGALGISCFKSLPEEKLQILQRLRNIFNLSYQRYSDIARAEEQAREAQIEAALERVRSRSMGMQKSEELKEVIQIVFEQLVHLNINAEHAGFVVDYKPKADWHFWIADKNEIPSKITHPYFESVWASQFNEAKDKGEEIFTTHLNFEEKNKFYRELLSYVPGLPEESKQFYLSCPGLAASTALSENVSLYIENFSGTPYTEEENAILIRFGKVFQQTYTRFLDLQKAEAQARESQIQLALERVRARTMAMQKSDELPEASYILFRQMKELGEPAEQLTIGVVHEENNVIEISATVHGDMLKKVYLHSIDEPYMMSKVYNAWKNQQKTLVVELKGDELNAYNKYRNELTKSEMFPTNLGNDHRRIVYAAFFSKGMLALAANDPRPPQSLELLERFASVFDLTYTRFLDLQKAEAQAREGQIQLALERVRARTMAMQHSNELPDAATLLFQQVQSLGMPAWSAGYCIWNEDLPDRQAGKSTVTLWMSSEGVLQPPFIAPTTEDELFIQMRKGQEEGKEFHVVEMGGDKLVKHYQYMRTLPVVGKILDSIIDAGHPLPTFQIMHHAYFSNGFLLFITYEPVPDAHDIFQRFGKVFDQTYTRFLDLQKAEAQAREAQIEAALEKVRSRSLAMHKSDELENVIMVISDQLQTLGFRFHNASFVRYNEKNGLNFWLASPGQPQPYLIQVPYLDNPVFNRPLEAIEKGNDFIADILTPEENLAWLRHLLENSFLKNVTEQDKKNLLTTAGYARSVVITKNIILVIGNYASVPYTDEQNSILKRFGNVFEQAHTRFLDLQKAEAQAREAQIEAALERVRSRSLAMHKSDELLEAVTVIFEQLKILGLQLWNCGIIRFHSKQSSDAEIWMTRPDGKMMGQSFIIPLDKVPVYKKLYEAWKNMEEFHIESLQGMDIIKHHSSIASLNIIPVDKMKREADRELPRQMFFHGINFSDGILGVVTTEAVEDETVLLRFGNTFKQSYTRFLDLQKAEAQTREAQIETGLERVRSRTMAMHQSRELNEAAELLYQELTKLGIEKLTCGYTLLDDKTGIGTCYMANPEGSFVWEPFRLNHTGSPVFNLMYESWKKQEPYHLFELAGQVNIAHNKYLAENADKFPIPAAQLLAILPHTTFSNSFNFRYGYLLVVSLSPFVNEQCQLISRFARVFEQTYTRFLDLKKAEAQALQAEQDLIAIKEAKQKAEDALTELQATQKQLVQSEKMASLGELTAGIAHEIQNPLNFVNNFSEVSKELLDEMKEAIEKGDTEDAKEIMNDVIQNLEKINHHGKRADGIVKGMLQHSRTSSGQKELTDINALCDEYLRLAYHGLRAKDKSFNAKFETNFDDTVGKLNVLPQDIGRAVLNLINNAFYAVSERKKLNEPGYEPTVAVSTKGENGKAEIRVRDNGTGIPQKVLDKIFQPFFTTKPTGQGTGLGLSLSYDIVTKGHGGELKVETREGEGTEFIILLPG